MKKCNELFSIPRSKKIIDISKISAIIGHFWATFGPILGPTISDPKNAIIAILGLIFRYFLVT